MTQRRDERLYALISVKTSLSSSMYDLREAIGMLATYDKRAARMAQTAYRILSKLSERTFARIELELEHDKETT